MLPGARLLAGITAMIALADGCSLYHMAASLRATIFGQARRCFCEANEANLTQGREGAKECAEN